MAKRLLSILLIMVMLIPATTSNVYAAGTDSKRVQTAATIEQIITAVEIMEKDSKGNMNLSKKVTRADYAQMLTNASTYKGKVSPSKTSLFKDVSSRHKASGYIKLAVNQGWMTGYVDGRFKPTQSITLREAINGVLTLLGYKKEDFSGNLAAAQLSLYRAKDLDTNIKKTSTQALTRKDCMNLFYNMLITTTKDEKIYAETLGYKMDSNGEVDYLSLVNKKMKGPVIATENWNDSIPFSTSKASFYRNGSSCKEDDIKVYDVLYYSQPLQTVWAYNNRVTGSFEKAAPNRLEPTEITVAGKTYPLGTQDMKYEFSTIGSIDLGDRVTILLGKDDSVVGVIGAEQNNTTVAGIVVDKGIRSTDSTDAAELTNYIIIVDTIGVEHEYNVEDDKLRVGDAVQVSFIDGRLIVNALELNSLYGRVSDDGKMLGNKRFAADVRILDVKGGNYMSVYTSRLAGASLYSTDILYYAFNANDEITDLILNNVTGDMNKYGILISARESAAGGYSGTYEYDIDGEVKMASTSQYTFMVNNQYGPASFSFDKKTGNLDGIKTLSSFEVTALSGLTVRNANTEYLLSEQLIVYLKKDGKYYLTKLAQVSSLDKYKLNAYYDKRQTLGGRVRMIIAESKSK